MFLGRPEEEVSASVVVVVAHMMKGDNRVGEGIREEVHRQCQ